MKKSLKVQIWEALEARGWVTPLSIPPDSFCNWWKNHDHCPQLMIGREGRKGWSSGISAHKAWQCACYRDEWNIRKHENAKGTGVNHVYFGWFRPYPQPRTELSPPQLQHQAWCKAHNKPDPFKDEPQEVPKHIRNAKSFGEMKDVVAALAKKMDMNAAIGWTQADSAATNRKPGEGPIY